MGWRFRSNRDRLVVRLSVAAGRVRHRRAALHVPFFMRGRWEVDVQHAADLFKRNAAPRGSEALRAQGRQAMLTQFAAD